jgi:hypothetical protein
MSAVKKPAYTRLQIAETAVQIGVELDLLVAKLDQLHADAVAYNLHRAQERIGRAITTLSTTANGLRIHAGKQRSWSGWEEEEISG